MSLLNSAILGALALAAIPLIIHLINRRRAVEHRFAAFEFLLRSRIDTVRRFRLRSILLLIIRTLLIAALVLAAALPVLHGRATGQAKAGKVMVLFDNSASMALREKGKSGFEAGFDFLDNFMAREKPAFVKIIPLIGREQEIEFQGFEGEFRRKTGWLKATNQHGRFGLALAKAAAELKNDDRYGRLILVSDFAETDWEHAPESLFLGATAAIALASTRLSDTAANTALTSVTVATDRERGGAQTVSVTLLSSSALQEQPLTVSLDNKPVLSGFADPVPGRETEKRFTLDGFTETAPGMVNLLPDSFTLDDTRYFVYDPPPPVKALVVDGDEAAHYTASETFFLEKALTTGTSGRNTLRVITPSGLGQVKLGDYQVLYFCNVVPDESTCRNLTEYVKKGGALFMSLGDRVLVEEFNTRLSPLFKKTLRDRKSGLGHQTAAASPLTVADPVHPVGALLSQIPDQGRYLFRDLFLLEPSPEAGLSTVLRLEGGEPLLLAGKSGKGRLMLYLSSMDMDWNDFPLRPFFLPFVREAQKSLTGGGDAQVRDTLFAGDTVRFEATAAVRIDAPDGSRTLLTPRNNEVLFTGTALPGHYRISGGGGEERLMAVNLDPAESAPATLAAPRIRSLFAGAAVTELRVRGHSSEKLLLPKPLWHWLLLLCLLLALAESLIAGPRLRKNKP